MAKKNASRLGNTLAIVFAIGATIVFQAMAPQLFGERTPGLDFRRIMWAVIIGGGGAMLGYFIGAMLDKNRNDGA